jgi:SAM-dependent methyltransferase
MKFINRIKWMTRKYFLSIKKEELVLEVGSGGNPFPRSNILVDAHLDTRERWWAPLIHDRPTIIAFAENLPFKNKSFDYVIASHVLEHSPNPEKFLLELQRVAKRGYIETPDAFMERINPYKDHRLEVTVRNNALNIRKKGTENVFPELVELYSFKAKNIITKNVFTNYPTDFHVCFHWEDAINFNILNPNVDASWEPPQSNYSVSPAKSNFFGNFRIILLKFIRLLLSQNRRNSKIDVSSLMRCPSCFSESMTHQSKESIACLDCNLTFNISKNLYTF